MSENYSFRSLVDEIGKSPRDFTKKDIVKFIRDNEIRHINFQYPAGDGRLKTLNFVINDGDYLEEILSCGERVDGSSLFPFIEANNSDLYVVPKFRTAYMDPFCELPTLNFLCSFFNKDGNPLESSPEYTLHKACEAFKKTTGMEFQAMGELEYYVIAPDDEAYPAVDQKGYHESAPYAKFGEFRQLCMNYIARTGGLIKYGHSEVGNFALDGNIYEQNEIEFLPVNAEEAAEQLTIAKWVIRNLAYQEGLDVTFAPKITVGKAGSGLHVHFRIMKDGFNQMLKDGALSDDAKRAIAGMMTLAPSITAFGNTNPTSYIHICILQLLQISGQAADFFVTGHGVDGHMDLNTVAVGKFHGLWQLLRSEVTCEGAHTEVGTSQIYRIRAIQNGHFQPFHIAGGA